MASASAGGSKDDPMPIQITHHEKGDSVVILWSIENFDYFLHDSDSARTSPFTVNARSELEWYLTVHFREDPDFIGVTLMPESAIPRDLRVSCEVSLVDIRGDNEEVRNCIRVTDFMHLNFPRLINKSLLINERERFIKDNTLLLRCELNTASNIIVSKYFGSIYYQKMRDQDNICNLMKTLHGTRIFSDMTLVLDIQLQNKVHKSVMSARSPVFESLFATTAPLEHVTVTCNMHKDILSALVAYIYTGNPYDIGCIPVGLNMVAGGHDFQLLRHFTEPDTVSLSSRMTVKQKKVVLKIKNFFSRTNNKMDGGQLRIILFDFDMGDELKSAWKLFLDLRENNRIYFTLEKTSCNYIPSKTVLTAFVLNNLNFYQYIGAHTMKSERFDWEKFSFVMDVENMQINQGNHLNLKIEVKVSFDILKNLNHEYKSIFSSQVCGAGKHMPLDFMQLKEDVLKMYDSQMYPNLILLSSIGKEFQALVHKFMVALHSPYLQNLFYESPEQSTISLKNVSGSVLEVISRFMYTGILNNIQLVFFRPLLHAAKLWHFTYLIQVILKLLYSNLCLDNAWRIYSIARAYEEHELAASALRVSRSGINANLPPTSPGNTSENDQATASSGTKEEFDAGSQDEERVSLPSADMEHKEASPRSIEEYQNPVTILRSFMNYRNQTSYFEPGMKADDPVKRPQIKMPHLDPSTLFQALRQYLVETLKPGQGMAACSQQGAEDAATDSRTEMDISYLRIMFQHILEHASSVKSSQLAQDTEASLQQGVESRGAAELSHVEDVHSGIIQEIIYLLDLKESPEPAKITVSRSELQAQEPGTSTKYLDSIKSVEPRVKSQPTVKRTNLAVKKRVRFLEENKQAVNLGQTVEDLGVPAIRQDTMELEGLALRLYSLAVSQKLLPSTGPTSEDQEAKASVMSKDPGAKSNETSKETEAESSVKNKVLAAKSTIREKDSETISTEKIKGPEAESTERNTDSRAKITEKNADIKAKRTERNIDPKAKGIEKKKDPEAKSTEKNMDIEAKSIEKNRDPKEKGTKKNKDPEVRSTKKNEELETKRGIQNKNIEASHQTSEGGQKLTVSPRTAEKDQDSKAASSSKRKRTEKNIDLKAKGTEKKKDPEAKSTEKNMDIEAKSIEKNIDPKAKGTETNKDPEVKSTKKNEEQETKRGIQNKNIEASHQTSEGGQKLTVSPRTAEKDQDSKAASSSKRKRKFPE